MRAGSRLAFQPPHTPTAPIDIVTAAPSRAAALRLPFVLVLASLLATGCGDAGGSASGKRTGKGSVQQESGGEVVIAPPDGPYKVITIASPATVSGTVRLGAPLQPLPPVPTGRDSALCGPNIPDSSLVQKDSTGLGNVVVWIEGLRSGKALPLERRLELESANCMLTPRVQGAVTGSAVNVLGHDAFRQHLRFIAGGDTAARTVVLLGRDEQVIPTNLPFRTPGMVIVHDSDHSWPRAYLAVFDHPYYAITSADGSFTIDDVPPGKYTLATWHERTGKHEQPIEVAAGGAVKVEVELDGKK
jgi:hypothetical protein